MNTLPEISKIPSKYVNDADAPSRTNSLQNLLKTYPQYNNWDKTTRGEYAYDMLKAVRNAGYSPAEVCRVCDSIRNGDHPDVMEFVITIPQILTIFRSQIYRPPSRQKFVDGFRSKSPDAIARVRNMYEDYKEAVAEEAEKNPDDAKHLKAIEEANENARLQASAKDELNSILERWKQQDEEEERRLSE